MWKNGCGSIQKKAGFQSIWHLSPLIPNPSSFQLFPNNLEQNALMPEDGTSNGNIADLYNEVFDKNNPHWGYVDDCICESCFKKYGNEAHRQSRIIKQCVKLLDQIHWQHEMPVGISGYSKKKIKAYCEEKFPNEDDLSELRKLLHDKDAANPNRRRKIVTRYWASHEDAFKQRIISNCCYPDEVFVQKKCRRIDRTCYKLLDEYTRVYSQWDQKSRCVFEQCQHDGHRIQAKYLVSDDTLVELDVDDSKDRFFHRRDVNILAPEKIIIIPTQSPKKYFRYELSDNDYMQIIRKKLEAAMEMLWMEQQNIASHSEE